MVEWTGIFITKLQLLIFITLTMYIPTNSQYDNGVGDQDLNDCYQRLHHFANASSRFTKCAVNFARPISFCQHCIDEKEYFKAMYRDMKTDLCNTILFNADRIEIVDAVYSQSKALWDNGNCDNCYEQSGEQYVLKKSTREFLSLANQTQICFNEYNICRPGENGTNCQKVACDNCTQLYHNLTKVYKSLLENFLFEDLCMDITDAMNITRKQWSNDLLCVQYSDDVFVLFTIISFICLFPVIFYLGNWIQSDEQKSIIIRQNRLATSRSQAQLTGEGSFY